MASGVAINAKELFEKYKRFVENNVETIGHLESAARILSYIVPGIVFSKLYSYAVIQCQILKLEVMPLTSSFLFEYSSEYLNTGSTFIQAANDE